MAITELKYTSLIKIIIKEENFKWHLEAFASEIFIFLYLEMEVTLSFYLTNYCIVI